MEDVKLEETLEVEEVKEEAKAKIKVNTKFDYRTMKYLNLYILKYKRKTFLLYGIKSSKFWFLSKPPRITNISVSKEDNAI